MTAICTELRIDKEFAGLCPDLTPEENNLLESSLMTDGCREPIIVWANHQDTILDGHNRYRICRRFKVPFKTRALRFVTREEAVNWIISNQLGRRNLTDEQKSFLRGKRYLAEKKQGTRVDLTSDHNDQKLTTCQRIGKECGVGEATIRRDAQFADAVDKIEKAAGKQVKSDILSGKTNLPRKEIVEIAKKPPEEIEEALEAAKQPKPKKPKRATTISGKAIAIKDAIAGGQSRAEACARLGLSDAIYQRAILVVNHGNKELIEVMDGGLLTVNAARTAVSKPETIPDVIENARFEAEKKNHKQLSIKGKTKPQLLMELLGSTYTDWKGAENNLPINSATIPADPAKLSEVVRLCKVVRKTVNLMLDKIEKELTRCSAKTAGKKTC